MSRLKTIGFAIKSRLEAIPELEGKVVYFRRSDIESEFTKRMEKAKGIAVVVRLTNGKNQTKGKLKPRMAGTFTISLFTVPLLTQKDAKDSDDLMDEIETKLQGWWPEDQVPSNGLKWLEVDSLTYPDDPSYDVSVLTVQTT